MLRVPEEAGHFSGRHREGVPGGPTWHPTGEAFAEMNPGFYQWLNMAGG